MKPKLKSKGKKTMLGSAKGENRTKEAKKPRKFKNHSSSKPRDLSKNKGD